MSFLLKSEYWPSLCIEAALTAGRNEVFLLKIEYWHSLCIEVALAAGREEFFGKN